MTDFAVPARLISDEMTPGRRFARGLRRLDTGLRLIRLGLEDLFLAAIDATALGLRALLQFPEAILRAMLAAARGLAAAALGMLAAVATFVARALAALHAAITTPFSTIGAWAWQITRPLLRTLARAADFLARFLLRTLLGLAGLVAFLAFTPALGFLAELLANSAAPLGDDLSRWFDGWAPSRAEIAALPWNDIGSVLARLSWAAGIVVLAAVAVVILAFGLWLLALSTYVAARAACVATPPALRGARRAGVSVLQALGVIAVLLGRIAAQGLPIVVIAVAIGFILWIVVDSTQSYQSAAGGGAGGFTPPVESAPPANVAPDLPAYTARPISPVENGSPVERLAASAIVVTAILLAMAMLFGLFAEGSRRAKAIFAAMAAVLVLSGVLWATRLTLQPAVQSFLAACADFLDRAGIATAYAAQGEAPVEDPAPAQPMIDEPASEATDAPSEFAEAHHAPPQSSEHPPTETPPAQADVVFPVTPMTWAWGSADQLSADAGAVALSAGPLHRDTLCRAEVLLAVGAASSDGERERNEALARLRANALARFAADAAAACPSESGPAILALSLGQSLVSPAAAEQRSAALLAVSGVALDRRALTNLEIPFDRSSYSKFEPCILEPSAQEAGLLETCAP